MIALAVGGVLLLAAVVAPGAADATTSVPTTAPSSAPAAEDPVAPDPLAQLDGNPAQQQADAAVAGLDAPTGPQTSAPQLPGPGDDTTLTPSPSPATPQPSGSTTAPAATPPTDDDDDAGDGAALDGDDVVTHQPAALVAPYGQVPPAVSTRPSTLLRGVAATTTPTARSTGQLLEVALRGPTRGILIKTIVIDLPPGLVTSAARADVRLDGPTRLLPTGAVLLTPIKRTAVVSRIAGTKRTRTTVVPAHQRVTVVLRSSVVTPRSAGLRVLLTRVATPAPGTYSIGVALIALKGKLSASGSVRFAVPTRPLTACPTTRAAGAVAVENARVGTSAWSELSGTGTVIQGYADRASAQCGDRVAVRVSTSAPWFSIWAFRLGSYGAKGSRLVWRSGSIVGGRRADPAMQANGLIEAGWPVSFTLPVDGTFTPGVYLLQLRGSDGGRSFVPLVVRDRVGTARLAVLMSTNTWQAYNSWGGASAYAGADGTASTRARIVSYDRPYRLRGDGGVANDELPFIKWAEGQGLDVSYLTDGDLQAGSRTLDVARALVVPDHSEYWTSTMRARATAFRDRGGNIAFLGANNVYWRPRLAASPAGANRRLEIYRFAAEDPLGTDAAQVTVRWRDDPIGQSEQPLVGSQYVCLGSDDPFVMPESRGWPFTGIGLPTGTALPHLGWREVDQVFGDPMPRAAGLRVIASNHATCLSGESASWDISGYSAPGTGPAAAGVVNIGTLGWTCQLAGSCPWSKGDATTMSFVRTVTGTLLRTFAAGPAGATVGAAGVEWAPPATPSPTPTSTDPATAG